MTIDLKKQLQRQLPLPKEDRDKVKHIALKGLFGFLIIMAALTSLSRAAAAITTPQVTVTNTKGGRIEQRLETTGSLKPKDEESMAVSSGLTVQDIFVEAGDRVKKGDSLLVLDAKGLEEKLDAAQDDLKRLQLRSEQLGLNKDFSLVQTPAQEAKAALEKCEEERLYLIEKEKLKVSREEEKVGQAEADLQQAQTDLEDFKTSSLDEQLQKAKEEESKAKQALSDQKYEQNKALERAKKAVEEARENLWLISEQGTDTTQAWQALERAEMEYGMTKEDWERKVKAVEGDLKKTKEKVQKLESGEINKALLKQEEEKVKLAIRQVEEQKRALEEIILYQNEVLKEMDRKIEEAQKEVGLAAQKEKNMALEQQQTFQKKAIDKQLMQVDIKAKQKEIGRIQKVIEEGGKLVAPADGIITEVKVAKGDTTTGGDLVTFIGAISGYVFEVEVTQEESEMLQVGDPVEVILEGEKEPLKNTVVNHIVYVQGENGGRKKISVTVPKGAPGMNAIFKVVKSSENYQYVLPIEALRQDNGSNYVLVVKKKTTTLGEQMIAERVAVMPLDKNESSVAVQGAFSPQDTIIVGSNKPISSGDRVRLVEQ